MDRHSEKHIYRKKDSRPGGGTQGEPIVGLKVGLLNVIDCSNGGEGDDHNHTHNNVVHMYMIITL